MPERGTGELTTQVVSLDGRTFRLRTQGRSGLQVGDFVSFDDGEGVARIGYVERVAEASESTLVVVGSILQGRGGPPPGPFRTDRASRAATEDVAAFFADAGADLVVGRLGSDPAIRVGLVPKRLNRHTFWCGQSGSGKTYALGVALEQVLMHTRLPIVVFDPNSDFVKLDQPRPGAAPEEVEALAARDIRVLRPGDGPNSLRVRMRSMTLRSVAAILRLDPLVHREEYNVLRRVDDGVHIERPADVVSYLRSMGDQGGHMLAQRMENLEVLDWRIWALDRTPATEVIAQRPAATVLDLGGFEQAEEQLAVALAVLNDLWARREERRPVLLVVDEAHNLASPDLESVAGRAVRDQLIQIAAEGRKFGLWLLLSTQRPSKVHPGIVSQCDNLTLMRMNSPTDLAELADLFGFVPRDLLSSASRFVQGEALLAGGFVPAPSVVRMRDRVTVEGGYDVGVPMP